MLKKFILQRMKKYLERYKEDLDDELKRFGIDVDIDILVEAIYAVLRCKLTKRCDEAAALRAGNY